jgi:hypothetical protein
MRQIIRFRTFPARQRFPDLLCESVAVRIFGTAAEREHPPATTNNAAMRQIFVQNRDTKLFLGAGDAWIGNHTDARNFETSLNALAHCLQNRLLKAQIVVRFNRADAPDIIVPVEAENYSRTEGLNAV